MKRGKVLTLSRCCETVPSRELPKEGGESRKPRPEVGNLWELLDRNISIDIWRKGL